MTPRILTIAGSDSGGGAGIQADIKTVTILGGHAMTAITAITAQNTLGVDAVELVSTAMVLAQIDAVVRDIGVDAIKIGMIGSAETAEAVVERLSAFPSSRRMSGSHAGRGDSDVRRDDGGKARLPIVFDPVMIATSGAVLADPATIAAFERLMRIATITTPNGAELAVLGGDPTALARRTGSAILAKGGDAEGDEVVDRLVMPDGRETSVEASRIDTPHSHGTGCTLSSAIAVGLGRGLPLDRAVEDARLFVRLALREAPGFGGGHGPMGHASVRLDIAGDAPMLNQITVGMREYAVSVDFYRRLGLRQIVEAPPHYARFETANGGTFSIELTDRPPGAAMAYFEFADLDATVARLEADGFHFDAPPADQRWGWREARLTDPAGNRICLYRAGENRRFPPWRVA